MCLLIYSVQCSLFTLSPPLKDVYLSPYDSPLIGQFFHLICLGLDISLHVLGSPLPLHLHVVIYLWSTWHMVFLVYSTVPIPSAWLQAWVGGVGRAATPQLYISLGAKLGCGGLATQLFTFQLLFGHLINEAWLSLQFYISQSHT